ncbi:hypothetical protein HF251_13950 [Rhizobium leguminosarum]|nr:hypothetical protein [Rhizobium leguminosarum]
MQMAEFVAESFFRKRNPPGFRTAFRPTGSSAGLERDRTADPMPSPFPTEIGRGLDARLEATPPVFFRDTLLVEGHNCV